MQNKPEQFFYHTLLTLRPRTRRDPPIHGLLIIMYFIITSRSYPILVWEQEMELKKITNLFLINLIITKGVTKKT